MASNGISSKNCMHIFFNYPFKELAVKLRKTIKLPGTLLHDFQESIKP